MVNSNVKIKQVKNLWVIDPNGDDGSMVNTEDLSISVELEVLERNDKTVLYSDSNVNTGRKLNKETTKISFIDGVGNQEDLTTHYTELNTSFNKNNSDLGTLGIESITLNFNSSYVPIVKINFKDVRGKLFELGNDSPYAFLFKMPYPIFYLTIKGYYGKPVRYALHMTKFNGELDNETGSFIIDCDFIGYTYAFLTDILMGQLDAIPLTDIGKSLKSDSFTTMADIINTIRRLQEFIIRYKNENPDLKILSVYEKLTNSLESIENHLKVQVKNIFEDDFNKFKNLGDTNITSSNNILKKDYDINFDFSNSDVKRFNTSVEQKVIDYNLLTNDFKLNLSDFSLTRNGIYFKDFNNYDFLNDVLVNGEIVSKNPKTFEEFQKINNIDDYLIYKKVGDEKIDAYKEVLYSDIIEIIKLKSDFVNGTKQYSFKIWEIIDIRLTLFKIKNLKDEINEKFKEKQDNLVDDFSVAIDDFFSSEKNDYDASIGSLFKILCEHVDLFVKVIRDVERQVKKDIKDGNRNVLSANKNDFSQYSINNSEITVGPFPEYIVNEKDNLVEKWLGDNPKYRNYVEVKFIDNLFDVMLKKNADYTKSLREISGGNTQSWFPVNPMETVVSNFNNKNPWEVVKDLNITPIMKLITQRLFIFASFSNKNITKDEITKVAKIEANQLFEALNSGAVKKGIMPNNITNQDFINHLTLYYGDIIGASYGKLGDEHGLRIYFNDFSWYNFEEENDGNGTVIYRHDYPNSHIYTYPTIDTIETIPLFQTSSNLENTENILKDPTERKNFDGSYFSNFYNDDNAESYIKIIDRNSYDKNMVYASYIGNTKDGVVKNISSNGLISEKSNVLGGLYKTHEFIDYETKNGVFPLYYEFYEDNLKSQLQKPFDKNGFNFTSSYLVRHRSTNNSSKFSLFGSKLYYNQKNEYAKALLFLHSLPFDGFYKNNNVLSDKNLKFFNERAGFISVPNSWLLFIGGLLYRNLNDESDILTFLDSEGERLIPYLNGNFIEGTDKLLIFEKSYNAPIHFSMNFGSAIGNQVIEYKNISKIILNLPESVKKTLIDGFISWVEGDWVTIFKKELEIFENETLMDDVWSDNDTIENNNYVITRKKEIGHFNLNIEPKSDLARLLHRFLNTEKIIINSTYRIWEEDSNKLFGMPKVIFDEFIFNFFTTYKNLNVDTVDANANAKQNTFNSSDNSDIKLSLYKNIKSFYNKWVVGIDEGSGLNDVIINGLYNSFSFIDRAHIDISDKFKISSSGFIDYFLKNKNINFYNFIARILNSNNFDFIPLPNFIDYTSKSSVKGIFEPVRFNEMSSTVGPKFICMYFGERSSQLNVDKKNKLRLSDSFNLNTNYDSNNELVILNEDEIPKDFNGENSAIPYFMVNYADQNQSIFKKIKLNQNEFTETNESLEIIDNLSNLNRNNSIGQNLFDIYNNRSYSAEVEMLGCAQIQPFMYFQINNVPIFDGAYTIINTSHTITPNHMTTTFKGVRIREIKTKMVDNETLYAHLITNLNDVNSDGYKIGDLNKSNYSATNQQNLKDGNEVPKFHKNDASQNEINEVLFIDPLKNPKNGEIFVTSGYGPRNIGNGFHFGIDFRADIGDDVVAVTDLLIKRIRYQPDDTSGGLYLEFTTKNDMIVGGDENKKMYINYMHLSDVTHKTIVNWLNENDLSLDKNFDSLNQKTFNSILGKEIKKGEIIAKTGNSGTKDPHLHMSFRITDSYVKNGLNYKNPFMLFKNKDKWKWSKNQNVKH